ncbi:MAG: magnesium and cobalt transport protein CorA, partial [Desulfobacterales bacterium]|nr:magnesium and cobalt transport protein CorA [Desulfobacterales bacterium]
KMNEVMKVLTIIATIFIPLTFIAGIYGMNFKYMPELEWKYGYEGVWILMIVIVCCMFVYFRKKKWF